ncbi:hypothetical protein D6C85_09062 [Aureobasidium pullulans]|uniref:Xylanolytic transcriptional activator regulatory domain-containing protein n=1 Tax=Aureobasidium pullulans TaxID=5580 RepID=A0A4S9WC38_AURPU|nr:hypothetical protein D6C85_09062 [Aureobasidium pullulans]
MGLHAGLDFLYDPAFNFQDMASTQNDVYTVANEPVQLPSLPTDSATTVHAASTQTRIRPMEDDFEELGPVPCPWKIHEEERSQILGALSPFHHLLIGFALPSRLALGRYITGLLAAYLRSSNPLAKSSSKTNCKNWHDWVIHESYRRTQLGIFFVLNLHTVFFDKPPIALTSQLDVDLPCPTAEWIAPSQSAWDNARMHTPNSVSFQDAFSALFSEPPADKHLNYSPFANLVLIHALLQRIYLARQMQSNPSGSLREADMYEMGPEDPWRDHGDGKK